MAKHYYKKCGKERMSFRLPSNCNLKYISVMSGCMSMPDATSLHHYLKNKQLKLIIAFSVKGPTKAVFNNYAGCG